MFFYYKGQGGEYFSLGKKRGNGNWQRKIYKSIKAETKQDGPVKTAWKIGIIYIDITWCALSENETLTKLIRTFGIKLSYTGRKSVDHIFSTEVVKGNWNILPILSSFFL